MSVTERTIMSEIKLLDIYQRMLVHQREHDGLLIHPMPGRPEQPHWWCMACLRGGRVDDSGDGREIRKRYSFAIPNDQALDAIAEYSPGGVVEIGAGGGYWAMLLQQRGVDVIAYDPDPPGITGATPRPSGHTTECPQWHSGLAWTAVHEGDHRKAADHPTRTLLLCWPSYDEPWAAQAVELYKGDTVVYIGEGSGGCTADDLFHTLVGEEQWCWHRDDDGKELPCPPDCLALVKPLFTGVAAVGIPQWSGLRDYLRVYRRLATQ